jgi:hypothetical protein
MQGQVAAHAREPGRSKDRLRAIMRLAAFLFLVVQLGAFVHVLEHYFVPEQMECGEDSCAAFAPATGPVVLPDLAAPPVFVVFFVCFQQFREWIADRPRGLIGFDAHAPPA